MRISYIALLFTVCAPYTSAQSFVDSAFVETRVVTEGLIIPWDILWGPDNWLWVTERHGRVSRINPTTGERRLIMSLPNTFGLAEAGMLGMAVHPDFAANPYVYIADVYNSDTNIVERIVRYRYVAADDTLLRDRVMLDSIRAGLSHAGCRLAIGPDSALYMTIGERASDPYDAPSHLSILGKTLRINLDGTVPVDNPWPAYEWPMSLIWTTGHRNSQGLAFARSGTLYATEHGPNSFDEINLLVKGRNYGWPHAQGMCDDVHDSNETVYCRDSSIVEPIHTFAQTIGPTGVVHYDHPLIDEWRGSLLLTSLGIVDNTPVRPTQSIVQLKLSDEGDTVVERKVWFANAFGRLRDICIAPDGRVFVATSNHDKRYWPAYEKYPSDRIYELAPRLDTITWVATAGVPDTAHVCASDSTGVVFAAKGTFRAGNRFIIELSDERGSFDHPTELGSTPVFSGQTPPIGWRISIRIPDSNATSNRYRIRAASTRPYRTSSDTGNLLMIHARPLPLIVNEAGRLRTDRSYSSYEWLRNGVTYTKDSVSFTPRESGRYSVRVVDMLGCRGTSTAVEIVITGIAMHELPSSSVRVHPQPARDQITVEISNTTHGDVHLTLTDVNGARVFTGLRNAMRGMMRWDIPVESFAPGVYLLEVRTAEGRWSDKIVVQ